MNEARAQSEEDHGTPDEGNEPVLERSPGQPPPARRWGSRLLVVSFIAVAIACVIGVALFRHHARAQFGSMLETGEAERIRAFTGLLRMNGLRSLARRYVYLPAYAERTQAGGATFAKTADEGGEPLYVVRGFDMDAPEDAPDASLRGIVLVCSPNGRVRYTVENVALLPAPGVGGTGAPVETPAALLWGHDGERHYFYRARRDRESLLVATGTPRLETASGIVRLEGTGIVHEPEATRYLRWEPHEDRLETVGGDDGEEAWRVQ